MGAEGQSEQVLGGAVKSDDHPKSEPSEEREMTRSEENRLYALTAKQGETLLDAGEIVEMLRLTQKKAKETIAKKKKKRSK